MTSYNASGDTIERIAFLVYAARPQWDTLVVKLVLEAHALQVDGTDLAIAALRAAQNPDLPSPKAIGWRGPHWDGLGTKPPNISAPDRCATCGRTEPECYSRRPGLGDDHVFESKERRARRLQREREAQTA